MGDTIQAYRYAREMAFNREQIKWCGIDQSTYEARINDYVLVISRYEAQPYYWGITDAKIQLASKEGYDSLEQAKEGCLKAYVEHLLS